MEKLIKAKQKQSADYAEYDAALLYNLINIYNIKITEDTLTKANKNVSLRRAVSSDEDNLTIPSKESQEIIKKIGNFETH